MDYRIPLLSYDDPNDAREPAVAAATSTAAAASSTRAAAIATDTEAASKPAKAKGILKNKPQSSKASRSLKPQSSDAGSSAGVSDARSNALQELGKERKRRAFMGMLKLLEHGAKDSQQLHALVAPMSDEELLQVAEERALAGKCGNPLCSKPFTWQEPRSKFLVSADNISKVEGDSYCSKACSSFIQQLAVQLVNPMSRIKPAAFEEYLARPSHRPKQGVAAQGGGVETMRAVIEERAPYQLIHEAEEAGKQLDAAAAAASGDRTTAAAVEGYVPRSTPAKQPQQQQEQQQQQQQEPMEVLQLQPVLKLAPQPAPAPATDVARLTASNAADSHTSTGTAAATAVSSAAAAAAAAAAAGGSSTSTPALSSAAAAAAANGTSSLDSMLKAFRQVQNKQLQEISNQHDDAVDITAAGQRAAAAAGVQIHSSSSSSNSQSEQSSSAAETNETAVESVQQPPQRGRTVTFAPNVEYSCPADPQQLPPEQPVLTFTMHDPGSPLDLGNAANGSSSGGGLIGELQLTGAGDLDPHLTAAAAAAAAGDSEAESESHSDPDSPNDSESGGGDEHAAGSRATAASSDLPPMPDAWKLFLPPALGGIGVPVKQLVKTRPVKKQQQQQQRSKISSSMQDPAVAGNEGCKLTAAGSSVANSTTRQQQQQQQQGRRHTVGTSSERIDAADRSSSRSLPAGPAPQSTSFKVQAALQSKLAPSNSQQAQQQEATGISSDSTSAGGNGVATIAAAAPRPRKFAPVVRPRRSVVILDDNEVPGVIVKQRGVRPGSSAAARSSAQQQQQQQPIGPHVLQAAPHEQGGGRQQPAVAATDRHPAAAAARPGTVVRSAINGSTAIIADSSSSSDGSGDEADTLYDPGSEQSEEEQWCHEPVYAAGNSSSRSSANRSGQRHNQKGASNSSEEETEDDIDKLDSFGQNESELVDDEPWSDEGLSLGDLGLSSDILGQQGKTALEAVLPFLDTKGVTVHLSEFGFMWNTLHEWVSPATVAYVSREQHCQEPALAATAVRQDCTFAVAAAGAAAGASSCEAGDAADQQSQQVVPSLAVVQQRQAMATMLGHALPFVTEQLGIMVPGSALNRHLNALVRSFYMSRPLPALHMQQWQLITGLMLAALSAWRLPVLRPVFAKHQEPGSRLRVLLSSLGSDVDKFMALLDLFELDA